jgi:hypothetical protein
MTLRTSTLVLVALVLAVAADAMSADDFVLIRGGASMSGAIVLVPSSSSGDRKIKVHVGESVTLFVRDVSNPPCRAKITVNAVVGTNATITPNGSKGFVRDQSFDVTGTSVGTTTFQIGVVGEGGACNEQSVNDVVVEVVADPHAAEASAGQFSAQIVKDTKSTLTAGLNKLKGDVAGVKAAIKGGTFSPQIGACKLLEAYYDALWDAGNARRAAIDGFRSKIVDDVKARGFTELDEARGLMPGYGAGAWVQGLRNIRMPFRAYDEKVLAILAKDAQSLEKSFSTSEIPFYFNYECCCDCCCCEPYPPTISEIFTPPSTRVRLDIGAIGAVSMLSPTAGPIGSLWIVGHGDPTQGTVEADLLAGDGTTATQTATMGSDGKFRLYFTAVKPGLLYHVGLKYPGASSTYRLPERYIGVPFVE